MWTQELLGRGEGLWARWLVRATDLAQEIAWRQQQAARGAGHVNTLLQDSNNTIQVNAFVPQGMTCRSKGCAAQAEVLRSVLGLFRL